MRRILESTKLARPGKDGVKVGRKGKCDFNGRDELDGRVEIGDGKINGNEVGDNEVAKRKSIKKIETQLSPKRR